MPDAYTDLCATMIADLEAQLPVAREGQKAEIRRAITRWRRAARKPVVEYLRRSRRSAASRFRPGQWRLGVAR